MTKTRTRGAETDPTLVALWIPKPMKEALKRAVKIQDTDRSKFIRAAIREKLDRESHR